MLSRLVLVFLFVVQTNSLSVLTDDKSQATKTDGETVLVRQLLNQETLIRMALDRKVNDLVKVIAEIQNSLGTNNQQLQDAKKEIQTINQQLLDAKKEIAALKNENSALKAEWQVQSNITTPLSDKLKTTMNSLKQSQNSQQELSSAVSSLQVFQRNMSVLSGSAKDTPVAFTAGITSSSSTWRGDILVFPHVITNKGQGYSSSSGKFTAPRDGTYVFTVTGVSFGKKPLNLDIVHDGDSKVRTWSDNSASQQTGTNLVVLELDRGDAVWVGRYNGGGYWANSVPVTTFSGFIL
uniref:Caprin-2-like n=1 Tax=Crassostrea virginica TaxID=6565 RepID=A0A8B8CDM8_CRAVI|nr:caprin-2-like [Crassostrea virginica]XP_022313886.1 caprin-2-like [Crassostrea virginica]XP_022313893.1 caprin-2-like [Crassostrea virginica]